MLQYFDIWTLLLLMVGVYFIYRPIADNWSKIMAAFTQETPEPVSATSTSSSKSSKTKGLGRRSLKRHRWVSRSGHGCTQRLQRIFSSFQAPKDYGEEQQSFERTIDFLSSVPLFKKQLPKSELPKVAQELKRRTWKPGQVLVRRLVVTCEKPGAPDIVRATLVEGDYFGGSNVATIVAKGRLVTLSLSRERFDALGLRRWLQFPKRPAIYNAPQETRRTTSETFVSMKTRQTLEVVVFLEFLH
eukprot:g28231.t1